jgi:AcrR family transcriptional regulator
MDRRALKTQKAIRGAFLNLLKKKSINKITVAEISQLADLGRGTFYLHYKDIFDLFEQIENDLFSEIEQLIEASCSNNTPESLLNFSHTITEYIMNNRSTFLLIIKPENGGRNLYRLKDCFYRTMMGDCSDQYPSDYHVVECMFAVSGVIGVLEEWLFNKIDLPQKQIAESMSNILQRFVL